MEKTMDLKTLNLDELLGVINLYPWFGGARKELCARMSALGQTLGDDQYADAAMYVPAREKVAMLKYASVQSDCTDDDIEKLLKSYFSEARVEEKEEKPVAERKVYVVGGDFFSQEEYDRVRMEDDRVFSFGASKSREDAEARQDRISKDVAFYTETLAQIYAEQGYYDQAKEIYSKLILAYPEKNAYFAALIQKLDQINS